MQRMQRIRPFLPAFLLFWLALLVRIIYNLTVALNYYPLYDSLAYQSIGFNLIDEHCFCLHPYITTVYRPPLWPFLIAGISLIFGRANIYDRLFLCCIDSGTCVFIYLFVRDLFNKRIGLVAGLIACIYPALYIYDGWMYTESLFTFLLTATCYCVFCIQRDEGKRRSLWVLCGVLLALLSLTRPNGIIVIALVLLWTIFLVWRKLLRKRVLVNVALATLVACLLIAPWTLRNYLVSHSFVPVATGDGTVLLGAYNDQVLTRQQNLGGWINPLQTDPAVLKPFPLYTCNAVCEVTREDVSKDAAIQWMKSHLNAMPELMLYHLRNFWTPYTREADFPMERFSSLLASQVVRAMSETFPIPIMLLAALGLVVTLRRFWRELFFAYLVILITLSEALVYYGSSRFRAPIEPLLILLAAGALWWLTQDEPGTLRRRMQQHRRKQSPGENEVLLLHEAEKIEKTSKTTKGTATHI
ncbi:MAG TPA: glycosyltransferase family 39 protein [Ktedonobacteraceae bacterium]|nr:glycosyltransferase family 39 protein [Ktedonobacteraceae bacterium]